MTFLQSENAPPRTRQMLNRLKVWQQGLILVLVMSIFELTFVSTLTNLLKQAELQTLQEARIKSIMYETGRIIKLMYDAAAALALYNATRSSFAEQRFKETYGQILEQSELVNRLLEAAPSDWSWQDYDRVLAQSLVVLARTKQDIDQSGGAHGLLNHKQRQSLTDTVKSVSVSFTELAKKARTSGGLASEIKARERVQQCLQIGVVLNVLLALLLLVLFQLTMARRLSHLVNNTKLFAVRKPLLVPLAGNDELAYIDRVFHDTAAILSEVMRKETAVFDNVADVICSLDEKRRFIAVNPACAKVWDFSVDDLLGRSVLSIVHADDVRSTQESLISSSSATTQLVNRVVRQDGAVVEMIWSVQWVAQDKAFFCVAHDVSEQRKLERLKQEFFAMVAHDLRTPLSSVLAALNLMSVGACGPLSAEVVRLVTRSESSVHRLIGLINDLLEIEKLESGSIEYSFDVVPLAYVIEHSHNAVSSFAESKHVNLQLPHDIDIDIRADGDRLVRVLVNLLGNAIKYSPEGGVVTLSVDRSNQDIEVRVTDQGSGIPESHIALVFERFRQVGNESDKGGSGLGLAICKQIVEDHGGRIGVESTLGLGSSFWFRLPRLS